jgi:hypothetical protein
MTKNERTQVAQLLRCAADIAATDRCELFMTCGDTAATWMDARNRICGLAETALRAVTGAQDAQCADEFIANALETAARVEEGSYDC